jgi:hypothetical protein
MRAWIVMAAALACALPAAAQFQDRSLKLSVPVPKEHPMALGLVTMAQCTAEKSGGKLKLQPYYDGVLGNDINATQSARSGTIDMLITSTAPLVGLVPALGVFDLPFLFDNELTRPTPCSTARPATGSPPRCRRSASSAWPGGRTASATRRTAAVRSRASRTSTA